MLLRHLPLVPLLAVVALVLVLRTGSTAAPADARAAGDTVGGYAVERVRYVLDPGDPTRARSVSFDLRGARPARVEVRAAGRSARCAVAGGRAACVLVPGVPVAALTALRVVATG